VQAQIVDLLRDLQKRHDLAYMFISHDLRVVKALASELLVMRMGEVVEQGPAADIFDNPSHPYTRALLKAAFEVEVEILEAMSKAGFKAQSAVDLHEKIRLYHMDVPPRRGGRKNISCRKLVHDEFLV